MTIYTLTMRQTERLRPQLAPTLHLEVTSPAGEVTTILDGEFDAHELLTWFCENEDAIRTETLPLQQLPGESIAQSVERVYDSFPDEDTPPEQEIPENILVAMADVLFDYHERHNLRRGARGMNMPLIEIGLGQYGHEISVDDSPNERWCYLIDIDQFYRDLPASAEPAGWFD